MKRREFFKKLSFKSFIHPPYYEKKEDFLKCKECERKDCLIVCEEKIIKIEDSFPIIDFEKSGCTFCDECAKACKYDVLNINNKKDKLNANFIININKCLAYNQTICYSCYEICEYSAIKFQKGMFFPEILENCTSCGFCVGVCPTNAINIEIL